MFKILVIQLLYNFSENTSEFQIQSRMSLIRFLALGLDSRVSDSLTIWLFCEYLMKWGQAELLFECFDAFL
jgi:transposase, IS5 family